jgi:hypothetical protein
MAARKKGWFNVMTNQTAGAFIDRRLMTSWRLAGPVSQMLIRV